MRRTEVLQGLRRMKRENVWGRWQRRKLSQTEAAEMSEGAFWHWRDRYQGEGAAGLLHRRLGNASAKRVPTDQVHALLTFRARCRCRCSTASPAACSSPKRWSA